MAHEQRNTLRILLEHLFDYAGMFPPAARSFEEALGESSSFRETLQRPWMVASDLVLDTEHARKLSGVNLGIYDFSAPLRVCLLGTEDPESVIETARHLIRKEPAVEITSVEIKVSPESIDETIEQYASFLHEGTSLLALEPNLSGDDWEKVLACSVERLHGGSCRPALKCRLTGPTGIAADRLAAAIVAASDSRLPLKITGGLHHPIVERDRYEFPMGFLNVASGVMLRRALGAAVDRAALLRILTNGAPHAFTFGNVLCFEKLEISYEVLEKAKAVAPFAIGSCSLHEPDADLTRLYGDEIL